MKRASLSKFMFYIFISKEFLFWQVHENVLQVNQQLITEHLLGSRHTKMKEDPVCLLKEVIN